MKRFVVYTAISDGYDRLKQPPALWQKTADFVAFLEKPRASRAWQVRPLHHELADPGRNAKRHKILSHVYFPEAEYSLWVDGSVQIKSTLALDRWVQEYLRDCDLAVFKHYLRDCSYQEAAEYVHQRREAPEVVDQQMQKYHDAGHPAHGGLAECTVLFRRHTRAIARFNEIWHQEFEAHSRWERLSFNYAARRAAIKYTLLPGTIWDNPHFARLPHNKSATHHQVKPPPPEKRFDKPDAIILAHPRSGTHFLEASLASHPKVHTRDEFLILFRNRGTSELMNLVHHKKGMYTNDPKKFNLGIIMYENVRMYEKLFGPLKEVKIIHLRRNPADVARSFVQLMTDGRHYQKRSKQHYKLEEKPLPHVPIDLEAVKIMEANVTVHQKHFSKLLETHPNKLTVNYDEITRNSQVNTLPKEFCAKVLDFLGLDYFSLTNGLRKTGRKAPKRVIRGPG